ncbi:MAG: 6-hydroxymethylpterin diphosphokinase MptE-like protein [Thermoplasmatota archaeon]
MRYKEWEPIYKEIIDDFGFSESEDKESAELLSKIRGSDGLAPLEEIQGRDVEVIGPFVESVGGHHIIAAGSSITKLDFLGKKPDLMVTDLDGDVELQLNYNLSGVPIVIHAHGDNINTIKKWAPKFKGHVISSCQCKPMKGVYNFGGFTDGDRAVFIADQFNAEKIILNGWDFDKPSSKDVDRNIKMKKLKWARRLIDQIGTMIIYKC